MDWRPVGVVSGWAGGSDAGAEPGAGVSRLLVMYIQGCFKGRVSVSLSYATRRR
jgi:hypothetical protein